jgi:hypothetical protein
MKVSDEQLLDRGSAGLLNTDDPDYVASFVRAAAEAFEAALAAADRARARLLLRLLAALVVPGVLQPSAVFGALESVVRSALEIAEAGRRQGQQRPVRGACCLCGSS